MEIIKIDKSITEAFKINIIEVQDMVKKYQTLELVPEDEESYKICRTALTSCIRVRTGIDKRRKKLNKDAQDEIKDRNAAAKLLAAIVEPAETHLTALVKGEDKRKEAIEAAEKEKQHKITQGRIDELFKVGCVMQYLDIATMTDEEYADLLEGKTQEYEAEQEKKAKEEADRKAEEERLAKQKAAQNAKEAELKKQADDIAKREKAIQDEKDRVAQEAADKKAAEEAKIQADKDAAEKAEREAKEKAEAEEKAKAEAEKIENAQYGGLERKQHLFKLADAFFDNLQYDSVEYGGLGLDGKRPFGNSYVQGDILEIVGIEPLTDEEGYNRAQEDYADDLYGFLAEFLNEKWTALREITSKEAL